MPRPRAMRWSRSAKTSGARARPRTPSPPSRPAWPSRVDDKNNAQIRLGMAYISAGQKADAQKAFDAVKAARRPTNRRWSPISGRSTRATDRARKSNAKRPPSRAAVLFSGHRSQSRYKREGGSMPFLTPDEIEALLLSLKISSVAVAAALPFAAATALLLSRSFRGRALAGRHRASAPGAAAGGDGVHPAGASSAPAAAWAPF